MKSSLVLTVILLVSLCFGLPGTARAAADLNQQILNELRALSSRVSDLETQVANVNAEARQAKAEAAQARRDADAAKSELAALKGSSSSSGAAVARSRSSSHSHSHSTTPASAPDDLDALDAMYLGDDGGDGMGGVTGAAVDGWWTRTSLGGYGEMHLNLGDKEEIDFHRWVLFINHEFNQSTRLVSEIELEHSIAGDGKNGEIELEQAYVEHDFNVNNSAKAGLFLMPVGIVNETHEPTTFYGTERNPIERVIIPTTWWEGGALYSHRTDNGFQLDAAVTSGLKVPIEGLNAYRIRSGRQKVSEADAQSGAVTTRLRYTGKPGLEIAATAQYQGDIAQSSPESNNAWMGEAHIDYRRGGFGLRALAAGWHIGGSRPKLLGVDKQWGAYIEPSYRFDLPIGGELGVFARFNQWDATRGNIRQYDAGLNYWPIDNIVFKLDYSHIDQIDGIDSNLINLGFGYVF